MAYDATLPTDKDYVRFVLGDTETVELLTDAQILAVLDLYARAPAIAFLAQGLAARYAQLPTSVSANGKSVSWGERVKYWLALAASGGTLGVGGAFSVLTPRADGYAELAAAE